MPLATGPVEVPEAISAAVAKRFKNVETPEVLVTNDQGIVFSLSPHRPRSSAPKLVRISMERLAVASEEQKGVITPEMEWEGEAPSAWGRLGDEARAAVLARAQEALIVPQEDLAVSSSGGKIRVKFESETVEFPFRPVRGHWLGLDNSGRDEIGRAHV